MLFGKKKEQPPVDMKGRDFDYVPEDTYYFDSACQTMRPMQVIQAEEEYYTQYNACGHRVKYKWGEKVDKKVADTRKKVLSYLKKSEKEYDVVFTLNTTYGINLVLHQLPHGEYNKIITSDIEHNSVFLPSMTFANHREIERLIFERVQNGELMYKKEQLAKAVVLLNSTSNIDGRHLQNVEQVVNDTHDMGGIVMLDAAQTLGHNVVLLHGVDYDCLFGSVHKMYGPSLGVIVIKKELLKKLTNHMIGGGTVTDVYEKSFDIIEDEYELHATLELGLQNWSGIIGFGEALDWIRDFKPEGRKPHEHQRELAAKLYDGLKKIKNIELYNDESSFTTCFYPKNMDAHKLALVLAQKNIMARSGYFCCHYYLKNKKEVPPLYRVSLGLNNTMSDVEYLLETLTSIQSQL